MKIADKKLNKEITERKQAEEKYRSLFVSSRDAIMTLAPPDWKFTSGNPTAFKLFGTKNEAEFVSLGPWEVSPEYQPNGQLSSVKAKEMIGKAMKEGSNFFEWTHKRIDGTEFYTTVLLTRMKLEGKNILQATVRDITERKRVEKALESSNRNLELAVSKLEDANRELKDFVYIASHDLREPLRKIYSFGELLKDSLWEKLDGDDKENLEFMIDGASRMTAMIEGLLTYSRVGTKGKQFGTVDLNEVVEQLQQLELAKLLEETGGTIEVPLPLPIVEADTVQMRQLLQNLIANGIKYRRKEVQPQIVISAENTDGDKVRIKVKDNGIGIDEKYHKDIFKMFRRLHSREEYGGTGIGLAVCKKIMDRHNGQIGVESNPGEGTTFWFTLSPANEMAAVS